MLLGVLPAHPYPASHQGERVKTQDARRFRGILRSPSVDSSRARVDGLGGEGLSIPPRPGTEPRARAGRPTGWGSGRGTGDARPQQGLLPARGRDVRLPRPDLRVRLVPGRGPGRLRRPPRPVPGPEVRRLRHAARARASTGSRTSAGSTCADCSAGTVLCIETFEHVFEVRRAFDEVFRVLKPGGLFVFTSPLNFRIHGYPDDYWRMTPNCLRRMLEPYAARLSGFQGYHKFPHSVMGLGVKAPAPADFAARLGRLVAALPTAGSSRPRPTLPLVEDPPRLSARSTARKGERLPGSALLHGRPHPRRRHARGRLVAGRLIADGSSTISTSLPRDEARCR